MHVRASHENLRRLFRSARAAQCVTTKRDPDRSRGLPVSAGYLARTHDPHHQRKGCEDWSGQHPAPSQYYQTKKIPTRRLRLRAASCALPTSKPRPRISHQSTSVPCRVNPLYAFSRAREGGPLGQRFRSGGAGSELSGRQRHDPIETAGRGDLWRVCALAFQAG